MIRGSCSTARHCAAPTGTALQSFRANRASKAMPFCGYVLGSHEMLSLPAGQVTTDGSPVHREARLVEAPGTRLPSREFRGHRPDDRHAVLAQAGDEDLGIGVPLCRPVLSRQQSRPFFRLMDLLINYRPVPSRASSRRWTIRCGRSTSQVLGQVRPCTRPSAPRAGAAAGSVS